MSQPNTTSQKPKPPSTAEKNLSLWRYLPRSTPSMSDTATLTLLPAALRTASSTFLAGRFCGMDDFPLIFLRRLYRGRTGLNGTIRADERAFDRFVAAAGALARGAASRGCAVWIRRPVRQVAGAASRHDRLRPHAGRQRRACGAARAHPRTWSVGPTSCRLAARRQWRGAGAALGGVFPGDPDGKRRGGAARLRELSAVRLDPGSRNATARIARRRMGDRNPRRGWSGAPRSGPSLGKSRRAGLVVGRPVRPDFRPAGGRQPRARRRLLLRRDRALAERMRRSLPAAARDPRGGRSGAVADRASCRARRRVHRARTYAVHPRAAFSLGAFRERRHGAGACVRHRAGLPVARGDAERTHTRRRGPARLGCVACDAA